jgi:hypothetical protein
MDLVGRKLGMGGGAHFQQFMGDISRFVETNRQHPDCGALVATLGQAQEFLVQAAMGFLGWSQEGKIHLVALAANRFLFMMSQLTVGWLLLDAGVRASAKLKEMPATHPDRAFYEGKKYSALWYGRNVLPQVEASAKMATFEDDSAMMIPEAAFASV